MTKYELRLFRSRTLEIEELRYQLHFKLKELAEPKPAALDKTAPGTIDGSKTERAVEEYDKLQRYYEGILDAYAAERLRIEKAFELLTPDERAVLRDYYFDTMPWEAVAEKTGISYRHIHRLHKSALTKLADL